MHCLIDQMSSNEGQGWFQLLDQAVRAYPASATKRRRSRVIRQNDHYELAFSFNESTFDKVDALVIDFIANRVKAKQCEPSDKQSSSVCYRCDESQAKQFGRHLTYASTISMAEPSHHKALQSPPLHALLTQTLLGFKAEYELKPGKQGLPSLEVLSNILRVVPKEGINLKDLEVAAVLSTRVVRVVVRHCVEHGWLTLATLPGRKTPSIVKLTDLGQTVLSRGSRRLRRVQRTWLQRYDSTLLQLVTTLQTIARSFDLAYPHYISGYGVGDEALTGGNYLPAETGPPRVPARGVEWPVVTRSQSAASGSRSFPAQLCQILTQFALDYESANVGRLGLTTVFFRHIPDEGISLAQARALQPVTGNGKSLHERHMNIVIEPGKPSDGSRRVWPTQKTRRARDVYASQLAVLERQWSTQYGIARMANLKRNLRKIVESFETASLPDYPNTTAWMLPWEQPYLLKA